MFELLDVSILKCSNIFEKFVKLEGSINIVNRGIISDKPRSSKIMTPKNNKKIKKISFDEILKDERRIVFVSENIIILIVLYF